MTAISSHASASVLNEIAIFSEPQKWLYLVPTVGAIALGCMFVPHFGVGLALGAATLVAVTPLAIIQNVLGLTKEDPDNDYLKTLQMYPIFATLVAPIAEEGLFRGLVQPLAVRAILFLAPAAAAAFFGTGFTAAAVIATAATAALFGLAHAFNNHQNSYLQAINTTCSGIAFGLISVQFGLGACIAAHIMFNTIASLPMMAKRNDG